MNTAQPLYYSIFKSPIGRLLLIDKKGYLVELRFENSWSQKDVSDLTVKDSYFRETTNQLGEYFQGKRTSFSLPISPQGTEFQKKVWQELQNIPYGKTSSYGEIAQKIKNPKACRAVGLANSKNPIPIIIPCHRVIGKNGSLTGFGGGLVAKKYLLDLEYSHPMHSG